MATSKRPYSSSSPLGKQHEPITPAKRLEKEPLIPAKRLKKFTVEKEPLIPAKRLKKFTVEKEPLIPAKRLKKFTVEKEPLIPAKRLKKFTVEEPLMSILVTVLIPNGSSWRTEIGRDHDMDTVFLQLMGLPNAKGVNWAGDVWLEDSFGKRIDDLDALFESGQRSFILLLQNGDSNPKYMDKNLWNVTPEPELLERLHVGYTIETALAEQVDNALEVVWHNPPNFRRLISIEIKPNKISIFDSGQGMDASQEHSIAKWGTVGASGNRVIHKNAIGIKPPFLMPFFGKYGVGGLAAALHLGKNVVVWSKTVSASKVVSLKLCKKDLMNARVWRTAGEFREMTPDELKKSPHKSFTCVEISDLNEGRCIQGKQYWKIKEVKQMIKDIYSSYIQSEESGTTVLPVEFEVNGRNLTTEQGGEITACNKHSSNGDPFVIDLHFSRKTSDGDGTEKANARMTCLYFPSRKGKETFDTVLEELKDLLPGRTFENMERIGFRWLGRLLPLTRWHSMPFMDVKAERNGFQRRWSRRVKAFVDLDAGFHPQPTKVALDGGHPFTNALMNLGSRDHSFGTSGLSIRIEHKSKEINMQQLGDEFRNWVRSMHENYDEEIEFGDPATYVINQENLNTQLGIDAAVVVFHRHLKDIKGDWKSGDRIKLIKAIQGKQNFYGTIEWFFRTEDSGEVQMVCRPFDIGEAESSKMNQIGGVCNFDLGNSKYLPAVWLSEKCERLSKEQWTALTNKLPSFLALLDDKECNFFGEKSLPRSGCMFAAGYILPARVLAVLRPRQGVGLSYKQGMIIPRNGLIMKLQVKYRNCISEIGNVVAEGCCTSTAISQIKGVYPFEMKNIVMALTRAGHYELIFSMVNEFKEIAPATCELHIRHNEVEKWVVGGENAPITVRLEEAINQPLFVERFDRYDNVIPFSDVVDISLSLVGLDGQHLQSARLKQTSLCLSEDKIRLLVNDFTFGVCYIPTDGALLQFYLSNNLIACTRVKLYSAKLATMRIVKSSLSMSGYPHFIQEPLEPGEAIKCLVLQGEDERGNAVARHCTVVLVLDGLEFVNENYTAVFDDNGHLDLSGILRAKTLYNSSGSLTLTSETGVELVKIELRMVNRNLNLLKTPQFCYVGRTLKGLLIEVVDEEGRVDTSVDGQIHALKVNWNENLRVQFMHGKCKLPDIELPQTPGMWSGCIQHALCSNLKLDLEFNVGMSVACKVSAVDDVLVEAHCGKIVEVPFYALDDLGLPATLTDTALECHVQVKFYRESTEIQVESRIEHRDFNKYFIQFKVVEIQGCYRLSLLTSGSLQQTELSWRLNVRAGLVQEILPVIGGDSKTLWKELQRRQENVVVAKGSDPPRLHVYLLDGARNVCDQLDGEMMNVEAVHGSEKMWECNATIEGGCGFLSIPTHFEVGRYLIVAKIGEVESSLNLEIVPGNYPAMLSLLKGPEEKIRLGESVQYITDVQVFVTSANRCPLKCQGPQLRILNVTGQLYDEKSYESELLDDRNYDEGSIFSFKRIPIPLTASQYVLEIVVEQSEVESLKLPLEILHGDPDRLEIVREHDGPVEEIAVKVVDKNRNTCSTVSGLMVAFEVSLHSANIRRHLVMVEHGMAVHKEISRDVEVPGRYSLCVSVSELKVTPTTARLSVVRETTWNLYIPQAQRNQRDLLERYEIMKECSDSIHKMEASIEERREKQKFLNYRRGNLQEELQRLKNNQDRQNDKMFLELEKNVEVVRTEQNVSQDLQLLARNGKCVALTSWTGRTSSSNILGQFVTLARVESEELNRVLCKYIGLDGLLQLVCKSREIISSLEHFITGGRVIALENIKPNERIRVNTNEVQQLICLRPPGHKGFVDYAVNLVHIMENFLGDYIVNGRNIKLRELIYAVLGDLQVYNTLAEMEVAFKNEKHWEGGISLDGGIIRKDGAYELVSERSNELQFALVPLSERMQSGLLPPASHVFQRYRTQQHLDAELQLIGSELDSLTEEENELRQRKESIQTTLQQLKIYAQGLSEEIEEAFKKLDDHHNLALTNNPSDDRVRIALM